MQYNTILRLYLSIINFKNQKIKIKIEKNYVSVPDRYARAYRVSVRYRYHTVPARHRHAVRYRYSKSCLKDYLRFKKYMFIDNIYRQAVYLVMLFIFHSFKSIYSCSKLPVQEIHI